MFHLLLCVFFCKLLLKRIMRIRINYFYVSRSSPLKNSKIVSFQEQLFQKLKSQFHTRRDRTGSLTSRIPVDRAVTCRIFVCDVQVNTSKIAKRTGRQIKTGNDETVFIVSNGLLYTKLISVSSHKLIFSRFISVQIRNIYSP